jgi:hypothetical protein
MTTAVLSYYKLQKNLQAKASLVSMPEVKINWKAICFAGFFMSLALLVFYVWQINALTRGYYLLNSYEKQISQLAEENKNLELVFVENSFLGQALIKIQALNFQKATSVSYIQITDNSVALASKH